MTCSALSVDDFALCTNCNNLQHNYLEHEFFHGCPTLGKTFGQLPPHIFATADNAYHSMLNERENQTVIISGESGAGKTESTKFLLHHLMSLSAKMDETQSLELITLGTGPVLEVSGWGLVSDMVLIGITTMSDSTIFFLVCLASTCLL